MSKTFAQLGVPESIVAALKERGITEPFEIQSATIADALAGRDVCGRAPTGSGKTLAFGVPLVVRVEVADPHKPRGLVLAPTRELAEQISKELRTFAGATRARIATAYGGVGYGPQLKALRRGVDILVACPGRLEDLIERRDVDLSEVNQVVLDEADRMADMGFMPAVRRLLDQTSDDRQTVLFSATLDGDVAKLTKQYQRNPVHHSVGNETPDISKAEHLFWNVPKDERMQTAADAVNAVSPAIIFCRTRRGSDRLAKQLERAGVDAAPIHGGRSQGQRSRALASFAKGKVQALVATDVAARGIHVDGVASVVHYDPPEDLKAYVHRSGRTARAGSGGVVVSLLQPDQVRDAKRIKKSLGITGDLTGPNPGLLTGHSEAKTASPRPRTEKPAPKPKSTGQKRDGSQKQRSRREQDSRQNDGRGSKRVPRGGRNNTSRRAS
jgi:superfamily II DNA/RNA helicase